MLESPNLGSFAGLELLRWLRLASDSYLTCPNAGVTSVYHPDFVDSSRKALPAFEEWMGGEKHGGEGVREGKRGGIGVGK